LKKSVKSGKETHVRGASKGTSRKRGGEETIIGHLIHTDGRKGGKCTWEVTAKGIGSMPKILHRIN